ncbi:hypothetical protein ABZP36_034212 [Zizania latifolia]
MADPTLPSLPASGCVEVLVGSSTPSFPYLRGWSFPFDSDTPLHPKVVGVAQFLLFVEGRAAKPQVTTVLESIPVIGFFYEPCNYELFVKQSLNMEMAIVMAMDAGMHWIIHLDTDELLYPGGGAEFSDRHLLAEVSGDVDMVIFLNYINSPCDVKLTRQPCPFRADSIGY